MMGAAALPPGMLMGLPMSLHGMPHHQHHHVQQTGAAAAAAAYHAAQAGMGGGGGVAPGGLGIPLPPQQEPL
jgi:hypothetical protein